MALQHEAVVQQPLCDFTVKNSIMDASAGEETLNLGDPRFPRLKLRHRLRTWQFLEEVGPRDRQPCNWSRVCFSTDFREGFGACGARGLQLRVQVQGVQGAAVALRECQKPWVPSAFMGLRVEGFLSPHLCMREPARSLEIPASLGQWRVWLTFVCSTISPGLSWRAHGHKSTRDTGSQLENTPA